MRKQGEKFCCLLLSVVFVIFSTSMTIAAPPCPTPPCGGGGIPETDPIFNTWLSTFSESDPLFSTWDKSTGISITKSQITGLSISPSDIVSGYKLPTMTEWNNISGGNFVLRTGDTMSGRLSVTANGLASLTSLAYGTNTISAFNNADGSGSTYPIAVSGYASGKNGIGGYFQSGNGGNGGGGNWATLGVLHDTSGTTYGAAGLFMITDNSGAYIAGAEIGHINKIQSPGSPYWAGAFRGNISVWPGHIYVHGQHVHDIAEPFDMTDIDEVEQGDVVVIDVYNPGHLTLATNAYDKNVAGVISSKDQAGLIIGSREVAGFESESSNDWGIPKPKNGATNKPLAIAGRVLTKVSDENGPIQAGDLITTSDTPGHAMRAEIDDFSKMGSVVGKAL